MNLSLKICIVLALLGIAVGISYDDAYTMRVVENGQAVEQKIWIKGKLQVLEVPAHGDRQHVFVYLDFASGQQVIKYVDHNKCQWSMMDIHTRNSIAWNTAERTLNRIKPSKAEDFVQTHLYKLEEDHPVGINASSILHHEIQDACAGLPIYWAETVVKDDLPILARQNNAIVDQNYITLPLNPLEKTGINGGQVRGPPASCNPTGIVEPPNDRFKCHNNCVYQKCKMTGPVGSSCWWIVTCHMVDVHGIECLHHAITANGICKPCCEDPNSPRCDTNYFMRHCDCLVW